MVWAELEYTHDEVDEAGRTLVGYVPPAELLADASVEASERAYEKALVVINNWRSCHSFPLNTFQVTLRRNARDVDRKSIVAQRIKRLSSIEAKLRRFDWLSLSEMQDIGGCRAIVATVRRVDELVDVYKSSDLKHKLADDDDYIREPKRSGYRGVHLIYRYRSERKETYNELKIEMQFRTSLQHAWATAVETVDTFMQQKLKAGRGKKEWQRFFALMGTAIAFRERTPAVPKTPKFKKELIEELREHVRSLEVDAKLQAYGTALRTLEQPSARGARYFLVALDPGAKSVTITGYRAGQLERATSEYLKTERELSDKPGADAVLVSVESLAALHRAYPNYFLDTRVFLDAVRRAVGGV